MALTPKGRSQLIHLLNVSDTDTEEWAIINEGVTSLTEEFNPETETLQYIAENSKTIFTKTYGASVTINLSIVSDDKVNDFLRKKVMELPIGDKADVSYIRCCLLDVVSGSTNTYTAYMQPANIAISSFGGEATEYLSAEVVLNARGEATKGTLSVTKGSDNKTVYTFTKESE